MDTYLNPLVVPGMTGKLSSTITRRPKKNGVLPAELIGKFGDCGSLHRLNERNQHAVLMQMELPRKLHGLSGETDALKTAVVDGARHPTF